MREWMGGRYLFNVFVKGWTDREGRSGMGGHLYVVLKKMLANLLLMVISNIVCNML